MPRSNAHYPLDQSPFYRLRSKQKLAKLLGLTVRQMQHIAKDGRLYSEWDELQDNGKVRRIESPRKHLKRIQSKLAYHLGRIEPPCFLFCPVKGRSYVGNAAFHQGQKEICTLDVRKYFQSTPSRRVYWFFRNIMQCAPDVAGVLTALCTYSGKLPTGSPVSPILSYFSHIDVWADIEEIVDAHGCRVSVYMDDVTVSGDMVPESLMWEIKKKIHGAGLRYHKEKRYRRGFAEITGVIVREGRLCPPNRQHQKLHALRQELNKEGADREAILRRIRSREAQARQIVAEGGNSQ